MFRSIGFFTIVAFFSLCVPVMAVPSLDKVWECSEWDVSDTGSARCLAVEDGCEVRIIGEPYTLYSVAQFPDEVSDFREWNVTLESKLDSGAVGVAIGNVRMGLIFQVTDRSVAQVLFYSDRWGIIPKLSAPVETKGKDLVLEVIYDGVSKHSVFMVDGKGIFDIFNGDGAQLPMTSNINRIAVTTTLLEGQKKAFVLHKRLRIKAQ